MKYQLTVCGFHPIRWSRPQADHCKFGTIPSSRFPCYKAGFAVGCVIRDPSRQGTGGLRCWSVLYSNVTWSDRHKHTAPDPERLSTRTREQPSSAAPAHCGGSIPLGGLCSSQEIPHANPTLRTRQCLRRIPAFLHLCSSRVPWPVYCLVLPAEYPTGI